MGVYGMLVLTPILILGLLGVSCYIVKDWWEAENPDVLFDLLRTWGYGVIAYLLMAADSLQFGY
jgi:hypothetical protein